MVAMMTRRAGENTGKFVGVATLLCWALLLAVFAGRGNYVSAAKARRMAGPKALTAGAAKDSSRWAAAYGKLPLSFEENQGQTAREVRFVSHGSGYELFLTSQEAVLALQPRKHLDFSPSHRAATIRALREAHKAAQPPVTTVQLRLQGANPDPRISGVERLPTRVNYFIGNDPKSWHTDVPSYSRVKYLDVYPGVDLVFYGNQRKLEYDFIVAPGADPSKISFKVAGTGNLRINARGDLALSVPGGEVELQKPIVYQLVNGQRREIEGKYAVNRGHRVAFTVAAYDRSEPLILDPVLSYATYLGGTGAEDDQQGGAIALDSAGDAFIAGNTTSVDFPAGTKGGVVAAPNPNGDASFVAELDPTGANLLYSTYLAGSTTPGGDSAFGIALDPTGKVYVTGITLATDFPTTATAFDPGPVSATTAAAGTVYLTKLDPTVNGASALLYSSYVSGTGGEFANCVAADAAGNAYLAGFTFSTDFPTPAAANPLQNTPNNAFGTGFISRIDTTKSGATSLIFSTYFGGNGANAATNSLGLGDLVFGIAADSSQNAYVTGITSSTDSPATFITSATAFQATPPAGNTQTSAFVSKIATTAGTLSYSTYLAGSNGGVGDQGFGIALGPNSVAYVTGKASSSDFPTTANAFDTSNAGLGKAFISLLDATKAGVSSLTYSTFLGGTGGDLGYSIKADASGKAYVAGVTQSPDFAGVGTLDALGALQTTLLNSNGDAFVAKLNPASGGKSDLLYATYYGGSGNGGVVAPGTDAAFGIAIDSASPPNAYITGQTFSTDLPVLSALPKGGSLQGSSDAFVAKLALVPTLTVTPSPFNFGMQPVGVATNAQQFTVTNNTANAATFSSIVTTGVSPVANTDFAISNDACSPNVAAGLTCKVSVIFTPSVAAAESATLVITATVTNGGQNSAIVLNVNLSGTGSASAPGVGLAPASLAFGNQVLNTTSAAKTVTLTNTGNAALTINSIAASGDFAATSTGANACPISPATLSATAGSNTCVISVTFTPTALGARAGTLTVTDNAGGSPHTVGLTGTGTSAADFGLTGPTSVQNVTDGQTLMFNVTVTGVNGFNSPVALACTGAPTLAVCTVTSPVTPPVAPPSSVQAQVSMTTKAFVVPPLSEPVPPPLSPRQVVPLILAFLLLLSLRWARRPRMRLAMAGALFLLIAFAGCNGFKGPHTPKGPATLTITGTSGALQHTVQVQIAVN
jgi:hypothetical protein